VVVFYLDDMGYGQPGCYGGKLAPTPHIDALAAGGARFTDGYVSAPVCSPSRVGLMTGRYQARTGHDANTTRPGSELLLSETTAGQLMQRAGYATAIAGKWHLGSGPEYLPAARGFDVSMGTVSNLGEGRGPAFYRERELVETLPGAPVTSPLCAGEACRFVEANRTRPFFLYVAFNAVHAPHAAGEAWLKKFAHLPNRERAYAAQVAEADDAIGTVMARLRALKLEEETLVFCISDNGGAGVSAEMKGLRGGKWNLYEGGIGIPYIVQWKGRIRGGQTLKAPVIQLDMLPTALAAAGAGHQPTLDGTNLLPLLEGRGELEREALYRRFGIQYAVRAGSWKLVKAAEASSAQLFDLAADPGESKDVAGSQPQRVREMQGLWDRWNAANKAPRWEDRRWLGDDVRKNRKKQGKRKAEG
jgi:arylsulfatase A-like enzyme